MILVFYGFLLLWLRLLLLDLTRSGLWIGVAGAHRRLRRSDRVHRDPYVAWFDSGEDR